jgi:SAM-dependent methyltransferase
MSGPTHLDQEREALDLLLRGFQVSRMLRLVADLGVADKIAGDGAIPVHELATACAVRPEPLKRVLRALASFRIFQISIDGYVSHSPRSRLLRTDTPNSMHYSARFWTGPGSWKAWGALDAAMTGGSPHEIAWSMNRFAYLRQHPDEARAFDAMMANFPDNRHASLAETYDFSGARLVADIGGGNGAALRHILGRFPTPRGLLFDRQDVIASLSIQDRMDGRIEAKGGSFFEQVPSGADIYLLVRVLHDWSDDDCLRILRSCHAAMRPDCRLLIVEQVLDPDPASGRATGYLIDTQMMAMFGEAKERTEIEFRGLLDQSGFALTRLMPTQSPVWIIESTPIPAGV